MENMEIFGRHLTQIFCLRYILEELSLKRYNPPTTKVDAKNS